ncbi:MAG: dihydroorotase [Bacteroidales bacterium]|jgi:dihydroorotase|nr:dihydroorotase [Bacteroidales bacterium]
MKTSRQLIRDAVIVNEGKQKKGSVLICDGRMADIFEAEIPEALLNSSAVTVYPAEGLYLLPGVIDDQVHFREPGMTYKGDIRTESRAAVAGGVTSFMDMPNTFPPAVTQEALARKFDTAGAKSLANYSFYIGATNDNIDEMLKSDFSMVCGVKMFMGSSTGNMLVDKPDSLEDIFRRIPALLAVHCEKEEIIRTNTALYREQYGEHVPVWCHPFIRSEEACYASCSQAVALARKYGTRLHVLHLSTAKETGLFDRRTPLPEKRITAEVCVHHLWFCDADYRQYGTAIKWNPAIKTAADRDGLLQALLDGAIDVVATDHAPHTWEEKQRSYFKSPSGGPLVQHSLAAMLELTHRGHITAEQVAEKMCHHPAMLFGIKERGFIRKGYWADLVLVDMRRPWTVTSGNILYKCGWSPFLGQTFHSAVLKTWVNGRLVYDDGRFDETVCGKALEFAR